MKEGTERSDILERLRKVEGQVRGLQRMVEEERYCVDVLTQIAAIRAALNRVGILLLEDHTRGCMAQALHGHGDDQTAVEELMQVLKKFVN